MTLNRSLIAIMYLVVANHVFANGNLCHVLDLVRTQENLFEELTKSYSTNADPYFHSSFDAFIILPPPGVSNYYEARYRAYRILLDPHGFRENLSNSYRDAVQRGYKDPFGRFIDLAHGRLTNVIMKRKQPDTSISAQEITETLNQVVSILTSP